MPKLSKAGRDMEEVQSAAARVLSHVIQATEGQPPTAPDTRNAAAVALGRLGASKGGKARAKVLTPKQRKKIASTAAAMKWRLYYEKTPKRG
jgi:hypothetical protein